MYCWKYTLGLKRDVGENVRSKMSQETELVQAVSEIKYVSILLYSLVIRLYVKLILHSFYTSEPPGDLYIVYSHG